MTEWQQVKSKKKVTVTGFFSFIYFYPKEYYFFANVLARIFLCNFYLLIFQICQILLHLKSFFFLFRIKMNSGLLEGHSVFNESQRSE